MILRNKILLAAALQKPVLVNLFYPYGDCEIDSDEDGLADDILWQGGGTYGNNYISTDAITGEKSQGCIANYNYCRIFGEYTIAEPGIYYICLYGKIIVKNEAGIYGRCRINANIDGASNAVFNTALEVNGWKFCSGVSELAEGDIVRSGIYLGGAGVVGNEVRMDTLYLINLTKTFGFGSEPTKEQIDTFMQVQPDYFEKRIYVPVAA